MLEVNPDTVCRLIELARVFHAQEEVVIPEEPENLDADYPTQILAEHAGDSTLQEFRNIITDLEPDQQQQIVALLWTGRGDFSLEEWPEALEEAADNWNENTADYLIAHPLLSDYLTDGLDQHGYSCD
jgi:hypothetical protein